MSPESPQPPHIRKSILRGRRTAPNFVAMVFDELVETRAFEGPNQRQQPQQNEIEEIENLPNDD